MELLLKRIAKRETYTIGKLYIDVEYFCDTLEDTDWGLRQDMSVSPFGISCHFTCRGAASTRSAGRTEGLPRPPHGRGA